MSSSRATERQPIDKVLRRRPALSTWQSLTLRTLLVVALVGVALAGHWFDRDGLRDNADGAISFTDVVYFTAITVTTVGYGDIVPVTDQARMFDTLVVTPIRIFVWLIFLGTAYSFVLRNGYERLKSRWAARSLDNHIIVCGFGASGEAAVRELIQQGSDPNQIVVVDPIGTRVDAAMAMGVTGLVGDATNNAVLETAGIAKASAVLISTSRDDASALIVLSARQLNAGVSITATVREVENEDLIRQAGATCVINPVSFGGHLLARSASGRAVIDYLRDLASARGDVVIRERPVTPAEVGGSAAAVSTGIVLQLVRDTTELPVQPGAAPILAAGDVIVEVVATPQG